MVSLTTTIAQQKNPSTRCPNVSRPLNNKPTTPNGKSTVLLKAKSFSTMPSIESLAGNSPMKSKSTNAKWNNKKRKSANWMAVSNSKKNYLKNNKKRKNSLPSSRPKESTWTPNGSPVSKCVKTINDGCWWKSATKRKLSMTTLLTLKRPIKSKKKPKPKSTKLSSSKCSSKLNSSHLTQKCTKFSMTFWQIHDGAFSKMSIRKILSKITLMNSGIRKSKLKNK